MNPYEGMFVVTNKEARKSHDYLEEHIRELLTKIGANIVRLTKWDERQLAYEIKGQKEGIFYLAYFEAEGDKVGQLRRAVELSELALRVLILRLDNIPDEEEVDRQSGRAAREETSSAEEGESSEAKPADAPAAEAPAADSAEKTEASPEPTPAAAASEEGASSDA